MAEPASERGPLETLESRRHRRDRAGRAARGRARGEIGTRLGVERDEVRAAIADVLESWRREASRLGESDGEHRCARRLRARGGVARRRERARAPRRAARAPSAVARARRRLLGLAGARAYNPRMATTQGPSRNLGRLSEIAQVAARHGFGYVIRRNRLGRSVRAERRRRRRRDGLGPRPAPEDDARRARADIRQVRPAPLDRPGRRAARHRRRAPRPPGRRLAGPVRAGARRRRGRARSADRARVPRVRLGAARVGVDRPGAPRGAAGRAGGRRQGAAAGGGRRRSRPTSVSSTRPRGSCASG